MKTCLLLLFSLHLFTGGMLFGEIAKLPALAAHYQQHRQERSDTTLMQYLWLHYFDSSHRADLAHTEHHSLPFQHHSGACVLVLACSVPQMQMPHWAHALTDAEAWCATTYYYCHYLPQGYKGSLFQPPRA